MDLKLPPNAFCQLGARMLIASLSRKFHSLFEAKKEAKSSKKQHGGTLALLKYDPKDGKKKNDCTLRESNPGPAHGKR